MSKYINHEAAYSYVSANYHTSNIARCYLNLREQRNDLLEALEEMVNVAERIDTAEFFPSAPIERALDAIAKAKGEL